MIVKALLSIGSNNGDRMAFIGQAVALLAHIGKVRQSQPFTSSPMGFESPNEFINIAVELSIEAPAPFTQADALALLDKTQAIERQISPMPHRNPDGSYRDRQIDIDIIAIPGLTMQNERLVLPHPRASERPFVTVPLAQLGY